MKQKTCILKEMKKVGGIRLPALYVDGHERDDVVVDRRKFLHRMVALGFLNSDNAPTEGAKSALPDDLHCPEKAINHIFS